MTEIGSRGEIRPSGRFSDFGLGCGALRAGVGESLMAAGGARMAAALGRLAEIHALADINDAATWERETRHERALPGRDE